MGNLPDWLWPLVALVGMSAITVLVVAEFPRL
jgi:bacteriorhodopsin